MGTTSWASIFNSVDLPAPFLPTKAIFSFGFITKEALLKSGLAPNATPNCSTEIKADIF